MIFTINNNYFNIKYQNDISWVSQSTTLYYDVRCQKIDNMFRPFSIRPSSGLTWWTKEENYNVTEYIYRVPQEEWTKLRESVPNVKVYRYNYSSPSHQNTDITQNTYVQSWTVTEIMAREKCRLLEGPRTVPVSWQPYPCPSLSVVSYYGNSPHTPSKLFMYFLLGDKAVHVSAWHSCHV
jgi:hypothetical protein